MTTQRTARGGRFRIRPIEECRPVTLGAITVVAIAAALAATLLISSAGFGKRTYEAEFAQAAQIAPGDGVTIAGVQVGTVDGARLEDDHVVVTMKIDNGVPLGADTRASIKLTTLLGARYIELRPAGEGDIPDDRIPLAHTEVPYDLMEVLADATTTFEQVDAGELGDTLAALAGELNGLPPLMPQALANIESLSAVLAERRDQVGSLLEATGTMTGIVRYQQHSLGALVTNGRDMLQEITTRREMIDRLLAATTNLVSELHTLVVEDRPEVEQLIASLNELLQSLGNHDDLLRNTLQILPVPLRNFTNASGTANEVDFSAPAGPMIDSWMCALSGRAVELDMPAYFQECE
ncbi:MCE family protein [Rhodococcus sp. HM1]|uniref:MCE family protein n=1 Tax=Rhodococcus sp. HM1 TaxID=2937759 RepID=UPI00200A3F76|nr:MCE family protein [Rhodococcus sp. HM1]MCK8675106.1 MCE family protein [Rhodococcus sp. HM1]